MDPRRRLAAALIGVVVVLTVLGGRLVQLQGFESTAYAAQAEKQRLRRVELRADRGRILDRDGVPLALDVDARTIVADPKLVDDPDETAHTLAPFVGRPEAELEPLLRKSTRYVVLARDVTPAAARTIMDLKLAGITWEPATKRVYPNGSLGAAVVGFVGRDGTGLGGVEYAHDDALSGTPGEMWVEQDLQGRPIPSGERRSTQPVPGVTQMLTLDRDIQWSAERVLADQVKATRAKGGTIIVMDVRTGDVLGLATTPTFDPNQPTKSPASSRGNPAVSNVYEPGSVNKLIVAAAALESGALNPRSPVLVTPSIKVANKTFRDVHSIGTRNFTFTGVIAKSSNVGTIRVAQGLGPARVYEYLRKFGFGQRTGVQFPGESPGLLPHYTRWSGSQVGTIPIGQGVSTTALQIASVYATVANGGLRVTPRLVRGSVDAQGRQRLAPPSPATRVVSAKTADELKLMLEAVTREGGTATTAAIAGYRVGGKTGTARKVRPDGRGYAGYISSFVGFAPADAPRLVVSVSLDDPVPIYGGIVAAPVFRKVMSFALSVLRVPPTGRPVPTPVPLVLP